MKIKGSPLSDVISWSGDLCMAWRILWARLVKATCQTAWAIAWGGLT